MIWLVLGMLLAVGLAALVLATVALPARRDGRPMFTPRGAKLFRVGDAAVRPARSKRPSAQAEKTSHRAVDSRPSGPPPRTTRPRATTSADTSARKLPGKP